MPELMSREEVAHLLGIDPEAVRSTLRRHGITEQRGYDRDQVQRLASYRSTYRAGERDHQ